LAFRQSTAIGNQPSNGKDSALAKKEHKLMRKGFPGVVAACTILLVATWLPVSAQSTPNPQVMPIGSHSFGATYGEWNARWWQWFFSVPASKNPGLVTNGAVDCSVGQSGNVWFLAGYFLGSGSFIRNCGIPAGKSLLIPLINGWADNVCNSPPLSLEQLRAIAASFVLPVSNLHASVDAQQLTSLASYRAISPIFGYTLPPSPDNVIFVGFGVSLPGPCWPSRTVTPAVADGFYIMHTPLSKGLHRINFGGSAAGITQDITYNLTVD
jgi:hypothetical protein